MNGFPQDPIMLFSFVNTLLRDSYPSLADLCFDRDVDERELREKLLSVGYEYNENKNQFV